MSEHVSDSQLSMLIDGELSVAARAAVAAHIHSCPPCAERHDALIAVVSSLRLEPAAQWQAGATARLLGRLRRRGHDLALPIAAALAIAAAVLSTGHLVVIRAGFTLAHTALDTLATLAPGHLSVQPSATVAVLFAVAIVGPLLSLRLSKWR